MAKFRQAVRVVATQIPPANPKRAQTGRSVTVTPPDGASVTNGFDALNRLTQRMDGLCTTVYTYAMLGNGQHTATENGPWASDDVTVTSRRDVHFADSTDGGQNWLGTPQRLNSLDGNPVANDQWAPVLAVKPDGQQMLAAWFDRRNDSANSLIDVYGPLLSG